MRRFDETEGEIYLISLDTFMIMSVVGLSLGMVFFLLNPSFKSSRAEVEGGGVYFSISIPDYNDIVDNIYLEEKIKRIQNSSKFLLQIDDAKVLIDPYIDSSNVEDPEPFIEFYYQEGGEYQKASKSKYSQIIHSFDVFIRLKKYNMEFIE